MKKIELVNSDFKSMQGIQTLFISYLCTLFFTLGDDRKSKNIAKIFNKEYEIEDTVRIVNTRQAGLYVKNNIPLVDLFWSRDTLVFVFDREKSKAAYDLWCKRELI